MFDTGLSKNRLRIKKFILLNLYVKKGVFLYNKNTAIINSELHCKTYASGI